MKIFKEFTIFKDLRRIFFLTKILCICLWSIFRNRRIFVFVFSPFSIFVATLIPILEMVWHLKYLFEICIIIVVYRSMLFIVRSPLYYHKVWKGVRGQLYNIVFHGNDLGFIRYQSVWKPICRRSDNYLRNVSNQLQLDKMTRCR